MQIKSSTNLLPRYKQPVTENRLTVAKPVASSFEKPNAEQKNYYEEYTKHYRQVQSNSTPRAIQHYHFQDNLLNRLEAEELLGFSVYV